MDPVAPHQDWAKDADNVAKTDAVTCTYDVSRLRHHENQYLDELLYIYAH